MDLSSACLLVENLLDRIDLEPATGKFRLGTISSKEKRALEVLLAVVAGAPIQSVIADPDDLDSADESPPVSVQDKGNIQGVPTPAPALAVVADVILNLSSTSHSEAQSPDITVCLDFGTAMSKACAMNGYSTPVELALGKRAGASGYPVESSLFISDDGILHFGPKAECHHRR